MTSFQNNPERIAWIILITAFSSFCLIALLIPTSIYWYVVNTTNPINTELTSVRGIVLIGDPNAELSSSITDGSTVSLNETVTVSTNDTSQAILTFADDTSLTMYSNTTLILQQAQEPRFSLSPNPTQIAVEVQRGRVRVTTSRSRESVNFNIATPDAGIELNQGSFSVEVTQKGTQIVTRLGEANVIGPDKSVMLKQGQRTIIGLDISLSDPLPAAQNLLSDSNFTPDFEDIWEPYTIDLTEAVTPTASVVLFQNRHVLALRSEGEDNIHTEVGVIHQVNKDIRDFQSVRVFADIRLIFQSLPGGGQAGSEFPIMIHVAYKDAEGNDRDWFHGFYYEPGPENYILYNQPDNSSERIARFIWYPYESVNLLTTLGPTKPAFIKSIRIYASGWIYDSMIANISLLVEE